MKLILPSNYLARYCCSICAPEITPQLQSTAHCLYSLAARTAAIFCSHCACELSVSASISHTMNNLLFISISSWHELLFSFLEVAVVTGPITTVSHNSYIIASQLHIYLPRRHGVSTECFLALNTCILFASLCSTGCLLALACVHVPSQRSLLGKKKKKRKKVHHKLHFKKPGDRN